MIMNEEIKQNLVFIARRCSNRNAQTGNGGNISVRSENDTMLIKASRSSFADCTESSFVKINFDGVLIEGDFPPSRECLLHAAIYKKFAHINAVVHCHLPYATAWASTMTPLPFSTYHAEQKLEKQLRVFDTGSYIVSNESIENIMAMLDAGPETKGFLLKKHGAFAFGSDIFEASYISELIEETAKIQILSEVLPKIMPTESVG